MKRIVYDLSTEQYTTYFTVESTFPGLLGNRACAHSVYPAILRGHGTRLNVHCNRASDQLLNVRMPFSFGNSCLFCDRLWYPAYTVCKTLAINPAHHHSSLLWKIKNSQPDNIKYHLYSDTQTTAFTENTFYQNWGATTTVLYLITYFGAVPLY